MRLEKYSWVPVWGAFVTLFWSTVSGDNVLPRSCVYVALGFCSVGLLMQAWCFLCCSFPRWRKKILFYKIVILFYGLMTVFFFGLSVSMLINPLSSVFGWEGLLSLVDVFVSIASFFTGILGAHLVVKALKEGEPQ